MRKKQFNFYAGLMVFNLINYMNVKCVVQKYWQTLFISTSHTYFRRSNVSELQCHYIVSIKLYC